MNRRKREPQATTMIVQVMPSVAAGVEIDLSDKEPVVGVSYSPKRRKWRAYIHVGKRQVFHRYCETKSEAIEAHRKAMVVHQRLSVQTSGGPRFERKIKAPGYRNLDRTLEHLALKAAKVLRMKSEVSLHGLKGKGDVSSQAQFGIEIGGLMAVVELLVLDGAVRIADVECGMKMMVADLDEAF